MTDLLYRLAMEAELVRIDGLTAPSVAELNLRRDIEIAFGKTSASQRSVASAWARVQRSVRP